MPTNFPTGFFFTGKQASVLVFVCSLIHALYESSVPTVHTIEYITVYCIQESHTHATRPRESLVLYK
jgi:hypothetical protein